MTPCEKLGYKVGDEFEVHTTGAVFEEGDVIVLFDDDGSDCPEFNYIDGREGTGFIHLSRVRPLPITLSPGDYVSTDGITGAEYHAVASAFMAAGAERDDLWNSYRENCGWDVRDNTFYCIIGVGNWFTGRHLTISQVLNATNAKPTKNPQQGPKSMSGKDGEKLGVKRTVTINIAGLNAEPQQDPTPMTTIDTLHEAKRQRDEAAERLETAEAVLNTALDALQAELGVGFIVKEAGDSDDVERETRLAQPAEDMSDPANWRAGDSVECLIAEYLGYTLGFKYVVLGSLQTDGRIKLTDDDGYAQARLASNFRFVRRP